MRFGIGTRIKHPTLGEGVVYAVRFSHLKVSFLGSGVKEVDKNFEGLEILEHADEEGRTTVDDVREILSEFLEKLNISQDVRGIGDRWKKGTLVLQPYSGDLSAKEIPVEAFFHKIVMLRNNLRVLEQKINAHSKLEDSEKVEMQQYITKCYGTLTTFNILFKYKEDQFVGQKGE